MYTGNKEGDIVLVYYQEKPSVYARIEGIEPDVKKDWYRLRLLFLTVPVQEVTWILREAYINGDPFTMDGQPVRLERLARLKTPEAEDALDKGKKPKGTTKVIPLKIKKT